MEDFAHLTTIVVLLAFIAWLAKLAYSARNEADEWHGKFLLEMKHRQLAESRIGVLQESLTAARMSTERHLERLNKMVAQHSTPQNAVHNESLRQNALREEERRLHVVKSGLQGPITLRSFTYDPTDSFLPLMGLGYPPVIPVIDPPKCEPRCDAPAPTSQPSEPSSASSGSSYSDSGSSGSCDSGGSSGGGDSGGSF